MGQPTAAKAAPSAKTEGQFDLENPADAARYWTKEFSAAREEGGEDWPGIVSWQEKAKKVVNRYRANKKGSGKANDARINIFPANVQTQRAILVGNTPKCEVSRRFDDPEDDDARVASEMLERILNSGLEEESKGLAFVLSRCTEDRLLPGMCGSRVQFGAEFVQDPGKPAIMAPCPACQGRGEVPAPPLTPPDPLSIPGIHDRDELIGCPDCQGAGQIERAPAVPPSEKPTNETADAAYVNWRDQLWSPCRTPDEKRWHAYGAEMSRKQLKEMFEEGGDSRIPALGKGKSKDGDSRKETPWTRVRVWEVWSKEHQRVFWFVEGYPKTLTNLKNPEGEDPLGLDGFFPSPVEMMANATTDAWLPTPDFMYAEDLYNEADELTARIRGIVRAIKIAGVRDSTNKGLARLLDEACELELIPVTNWSDYLQKGGLAAAFQLLPVKEMVDTVQVLVAQRNTVIEGIYQITGLGDIIRGQQQQSETATTSAIKARFASVRLQDLQKDVARYATDLQRLRKEVVAKHWSIETIIERSCIMRGEEGKDPEGQQRVLRAAQLIKSDHLDFVVAVKPEQVSLQDWAQLKQQRSEVLQGLGAYFNSMMPMLQMLAPGGPEAVHAGMDFAIRSAQWLVAGMPGAGGVEAAFDAFAAKIEKIAQAAAQAAQQPKAPPPPDPKVLGEQVKLQGTQAKAQAEQTKAKLGVVQAVVDAHAHAAKTQMEMQRAEQDHHFGMQRAENDERKAALEAVNGALGPKVQP